MIKSEFKFKKYLSDNNMIEENLKKIINENKGKWLLLDAPCGSGKTYLIDTISKNDDINILLCPSRFQNLQNEQTYSFTCIIGNSRKNFYSEKDKPLSMVFEKIFEVIEAKELINKKVNLYVDEAQLILEQYNFRKNTMKQILDISNYLKDNNKGNVVFISGTTFFLLDFLSDKLDFYFLCDNGKNSNAKNCIIHKNENNSISDLALNLMLKNKYTLTRINDKDTIEKFKYFLNENDVSVCSATADNKSYSFEKDKKGNVIVDKKGNPVIKYDDELVDDIINKSALPNKRSSIITGLIDTGINIKGILDDTDTIKQEDISPIYIVKDGRDFSLTSIIQFFSRIRYNIDSVNIVMPNVEQLNSKFEDKDTIRKRIIEKVQENFESISEDIRVIKNTNFFKENNKIQKAELINAIIDNSFCFGTKQKKDLGCIFYNDKTEKVEIDLVGLEIMVIKEFEKQYFYNTDMFIKFLKEQLKNNVFINASTVSKEEFKKIEKEKIDRKEIINILKEMNENQIEDLENYLKLEKRKRIGLKEHEVYKSLFKDEPIKLALEKSIIYKLDFKKVVKKIIKSETSRELNKYIEKELIKVENKLFINEKTSFSFETTLILSYTYKEKNNKQIRVVLTDELLKNLLDELKYYKSNITMSKLLKEIKKHFSISSQDNKLVINYILL